MLRCPSRRLQQAIRWRFAANRNVCFPPMFAAWVLVGPPPKADVRRARSSSKLILSMLDFICSKLVDEHPINAADPDPAPLWLDRRAEGVTLARSRDWILKLPPKPEGHSKRHARRIADPHCASARSGKSHKSHGSHIHSKQRQATLPRSRDELQAIIDRSRAG